MYDDAVVVGTAADVPEFDNALLDTEPIVFIAVVVDVIDVDVIDVDVAAVDPVLDERGEMYDRGDVC